MESFPRQQARTRRFTCGAPRTITVGNDGQRVLFLRSSGGSDPVNALWSFNPNSGEERLLVDPAALLARGGDPAAEAVRRERAREVGEGIVSYSPLPDASRVCFALAGRVFLLEVDEGRFAELPSSGDAFDPRLCSDGTSVAYVSGRGVRITGSAGDHRLIAGTTKTVSWGSAEFVAAEEMGRSRGHWWAPDGRALLVARVDVSPIEQWWVSAPVTPSKPPQSMRYPAAGTANAEVGLAVVSLDGSRVDVDWQRNEFEYLAGVRWESDRPPLLTVQTRDQRAMAVLTANPVTGRTEEIYRITDDHWVENIPGAPRWWGDSLLTVEDRGDTRCVVLNGQTISPPEWQIRQVLDVTGERVLVTASRYPLDVEVVEIFHDGTVNVVSSGAGVRTATYGGQTMALQVADLEGTSLTINGHPVVSFAEQPFVAPAPSFNVLGERKIPTAVLYPDQHDGSPLPVLMDPYGGPHAQRVQRARGQFLVSQWFADQGFAVVVADGRGTPGRGPQWERAVRGDLAGPVLDDQVDALQGLAASDERLDLTRVGIRGWSFGGYLAALAVLRRPDVFHAAVAGAPVTDWRLYDTHYTERYLGHPDTEPENYVRTDLCAEAANLERPLLLIHGLADDNVVVAHTLQLSRAFLAAGRLHQVLPLSGVTHMTPQEEVAENLLLVQLDFLRRSLVIGGATYPA
ncbi:MAG: prolyl oligopeptidase family serine peptidase [Acidimicrobiales bacterium]|nr:prolyl oligopeptidase family serine peptidase [Acidimicrobiales bacterium]